jgi:hypothetical protein
MEERMLKRTRRARPVHALTRLPRRGYVIQEKHLRRFRSLTVRHDADFAGLVHMGEDGNEIWVEAGLSEPEKRFTIVHELVHARRQRAEEELRDERLEEAIVELETVARVSERTLRRMPSGVALTLLHDYVTGGRRFDPDRRAGLRAIYRRIWTLLGANRGRRAAARVAPLRSVRATSVGARWVRRG